MKTQVLVIGLGLIGASLCSCLQSSDCDVFGLDTQIDSCEFALNNGLIDQIAPDLNTATKADVIILALPVSATLQYLNQLNQLTLKPEVIVTDTGSTKKQVMIQASNYPFTFVGGHPMAGSHKSGVKAFNPDLFEEAYYLLTPADKQETAVQTLTELLQSTRAKFLSLTASEHDEYVAVLSHLPHIVAAGLVAQEQQLALDHPGAQRLAAGGFRDITRIASSDPKMWTDILLTNRATLLSLLKSWQEQTATFMDLLENENEAEIFAYFSNAKQTRDHLPVKKSGAIPAFFDLLVDIPDEAGAINQVTSVLSHTKISLINLQIQETREDIWGILQLTFKTETDRTKAQSVISKQTAFNSRTRS